MCDFYPSSFCRLLLDHHLHLLQQKPLSPLRPQPLLVIRLLVCEHEPCHVTASRARQSQYVACIMAAGVHSERRRVVGPCFLRCCLRHVWSRLLTRLLGSRSASAIMVFSLVRIEGIEGTAKPLIGLLTLLGLPRLVCLPGLPTPCIPTPCIPTPPRLHTV